MELFSEYFNEIDRTRAQYFMFLITNHSYNQPWHDSFNNIWIKYILHESFNH